jgi:hypothetical protein
MDGPIMVVLIVAIVFGSMLLKTRWRLQAHGRLHGGQDERVASHMQAQIDALSQRVQVLEKLVTDEDRKLADEIDRLGRRETGSRPTL